MTSLLTSSLLDARFGAQRPRVANVPQGIVSTLGPEVADFMRMVGAPLLPWQEHVCDVAFAQRADGKWAAYEVAIWLARQNGKGRVTEAQELFGAYMLREKKIIHSAHLFDTSREAFLRLVEIIEGCDWLRKRTRKPIVARGSEAIPLTASAGGGEIKFKARTQHGARGFSGDRIVLDEAYALTVGHFKAMSPTLATIPNAQITYTSSPPDEKTGPLPADAMAPSVRRRGLSGTEPRLASFEWSPGKDANPADRDVWYACNPSLGYLIDEEYLESQFRIFDSAGKADGFATEHLGAWDDSEAPEWQVFNKRQWLDCRDADSTPLDPVAFALVTSESREWSTVCIAGHRADGLAHIEIAERQAGTAWVVPWVRERVPKWKPTAIVINRATPAGEFAAQLADVGAEVVFISTQDAAAASHALLTAVEAGAARHRGQPALTLGASRAARRDFSKTWEFALTAGAIDVSPIPGCAYALWGLATRPKQDSPVPLVDWR